MLFGTADLAGTVIWLAPMIEHQSETGGKGGPEQKVFNYTQSIAIGLCERVNDDAPAFIGAIGGLTRVWENGTIVYDIRPQQEANTELGTLAETDIAFANRLTVSAAYAEKFTLYLGDETQEPDPTIEAIEGMGNVPGFRGLAYIVFADRQLQEAQGLRHPNFTFECYQDGTGNCATETVTSNEVLYPWFDSRGVYNYHLESNPAGSGSNPAGTDYSALSNLLNAVQAYTGVDQSVLIGYTVPPTGSSLNHTLVPLTGSVDIGSNQSGVIVDPTQLTVHYNFVFPANGLVADQPGPPSLYSISGSQWWQFGTNAASTATGITFVTLDSVSGSYPPDFPYKDVGKFSTTPWFESIEDIRITETRSPGPPTPPCEGLVPSTIEGYSFDTHGRLVKCNPWVLDTSQTYKVLQTFAAHTGPGGVENYQTQYPLNPCLPPTDPDYSDEAFWTAAYDAAVSDGKMAGGLVYGVDYPQTQARGYVLDSVICEGSGVAANVAEVVLAICKRAGLTASQVDVSDLTTITVGGYSVSNICNGADIISPLRSVAFFDAVESGDVLRFPTRGKELVMTLTEDQIGCFDSSSTGADGSGSGVPPAVAIVRQDETVLPRSIRFHYKGISRDYQDAEQDSPFRLTSRATDDQDISIPLCIGDGQAIQSAEILWSDAWAAQNSYTISVDQSLAELEGADCIGVPVNGVIQRMRIVNDSNSAFVLRKLSCVADNQGSYVSFAVASPPVTPPTTLRFLSPTLAVFLNIPSLMDADNNAGFYVVAYPDPDAGNTWNGATFYQSVDGTNFTNAATALQAGTVGTLDSSVPESEPFTWDITTVITVNLPESESFESRTDDAVLAGANAAAMGADGRWEIIQFATATQVSPTQWQLSRLLRGRRGTEYVMGSSETGDQFVLISTGDLVRIPLSVSQIGAEYVYKVVSIGAPFSTGHTYEFTSRGTALVPFSPVDASAIYVSGGDIEISWTRRDRLGETLMSGMDVPLSDFPESFQVDIVEGPHSPSSPEVVFRTLATGTTSVIYSAADFAADYPADSPGGPIYVHIYQMSLTMGRGVPEVATLEIS